MKKRKGKLKQAVSILLTAAMLSPSVTPLTAYAAEAIRNRPRYTSFIRPEALTLDDVGISDEEADEAGASDTGDAGNEDTGSGDTDSGGDSSDHDSSGEDGSDSGDENSGGSDSGEGSDTGDGNDGSEDQGGSEGDSSGQDGSENGNGSGQEGGSTDESDPDSGDAGQDGSTDESGSTGENGSTDESDSTDESGSTEESGSTDESDPAGESDPEQESRPEESAPDETEESKEDPDKETETSPETEATAPEESTAPVDPTAPSETDPAGQNTPGGAGKPGVLPPAELQKPVKPEIETDLATPSNALRQPEFFYDAEGAIDEPAGELVQFNDFYRTYETGEGEYTTVLGGYSGLYEDEDGNICEVDNSLISTGEEIDFYSLMDDVEADEEEDILTQKELEKAAKDTSYENVSGRLQVNFPGALGTGEGICMTLDGYEIELTPETSGTSVGWAEDNAVRYTDVYENIDYQYTVLGEMVKEDILLMEPGEKNTFSFRISAPGLKIRAGEDSVILYEDSKDSPVMVLSAPMMEDADGERSTALDLHYSSDSHTVTIEADEEWLAAEERAYPVRIDPGQYVPSNEFILTKVTSGKPKAHYQWDDAAQAGYLMGGLGNSRLYVAFNENDCPTLLSFFQNSEAVVESASLDLTTMTDESKGETVFQLAFPQAPTTAQGWNAHSITWNSQPDLDEGPENAPITQAAPGIDQPVSFEVTDTMQKWINGTVNQAGFVIKAWVEADSDESPYVMPAETFYNRSDSQKGPRLTVVWSGDMQQTDLKNYKLEDTTADVTPSILKTATGTGRTATGVITHGLTREEAKVIYSLNGEDEKEAEGQSTVLYPDFDEAGLENEMERFKNSSWQSEGYDIGNLELDTKYRFSVSVEWDGENEEGEEVHEEYTLPEEKCDEFLFYEVKMDDLVQRIARHYGTNANQIAKDNKLYGNQLTEAGTILFIRNPATEEPYTYEEMTELEKTLLDGLLLGRNPECLVGLEPVNINTGDFYMEQTDAELAELSGTFSIDRSYNSLLTRRSEFGHGWSSSLGEHLTLLPDGRILYKRADGAYNTLVQDGDVYRGENGRDLVLEPMDSLDIETATRSDARRAEETEDEAEAYALTKEDEAEDIRDASPSDAEPMDDPEDGDETGEEGEEDEVPELPGAAGWKLTSLDGTVRVFDANGFLQYREDIRGHRTTLVYDSEYALLQVITPSEKTFDVAMDEEFRITEITLPDGNSLQYEYDNGGNLSVFTDPEGHTRHYFYDDAHHMTSWQDENGNTVVENTYDEKGRVVSQTDANGNTASLTYGEGHTVMTDNRGNETTVYFDELGRTVRTVYPDGAETGDTYDETGHRASHTDEEGNTTVYSYDENGNMVSETRGDQSSASYTYNDRNQVLTRTDYEGHTSSFTYDEAGNVLTSADGAGNTTVYEYDELNRLASVTDPNGGTTRYSYDGMEAVPSAVTDGKGNTTSYTYDEMNRLLSSADSEGRTTSHAYNAKGWETMTTAPDGGETRYEFSPAGEVLSITDAMGATTVFTYDPMHNILSGTDALGNTLSYTYDGNYNKISETDAKGNTTRYEYDSRDRLVKTTDALGNTVALTLDGKGNILSQTDRRGNTASYTQDTVLDLPAWYTDRSGASTHYTYDRNGNILRTDYADGSSVSYAYDGAGRMVSMTAQNGLVTRMDYDGCGNIIRVTDDETRVYRYGYDHNNRLILAEDPLGGITRYTYDGSGNQTSQTDANGHTASYGYDAAGRLTQVKDALEGVTATEYDLNGRTVKTTDANGHSTAYYYDEIGDLLAQTDPAGNVTAMEYDALGNVLKVTDALKGETANEVDALSRTVKTTDAMGGVYEHTYDANGNRIKTVMPDRDEVTMSYDPEDRMVSYTDEAGVETRYEYDAMGRITKAEDTAGNVMAYEYDASGNLVKQTDTIGREAVYEYDLFNRLVAVTDTGGATTRYEYDALDRLVRVTQADGAATSYEYDAAGNLVKTTEPGEAVYTYAYDAINRLTDKVDPVGASTTFQYDAKGNLLSTTDGNGTQTRYAYDVLDRLTAFTDGMGNDTLYEYDELSRLLSQTTPEGNKEEYRYDALSRLTKKKDPNGLITEYQYDPMGNLIKEISPKGARTAYTYDKHDELTSITDPAGNVTAYTVDMNRQVTEMVQKNGGTYHYAYDAVHRLTSITTPLGLKQEFTYDNADNVVKDTDNLGRTNTYEYDIMHRMLASTNAKGGTTTFGYDVRGNQNTMTDASGYTWNYTYDLVDRLTESVDPEGKATKAVYDLVGNITSITRPGERTTAYDYDKNYNQTSLTDPKGFVYGSSYDKDNRVIGTADPLSQTEAVTYDPGSRMTAVQDKMGLTSEYTYDAHGNVTRFKGTNGLSTLFSYDILDNLTSVTDPMERKTTYTYDEMGNLLTMTDPKLRVTAYTYDLEGNLTTLTSPMGREERYVYDAGGRRIQRLTPGGNVIIYDYDTLNALADKLYQDGNEEESDHPVRMGYNAMGQRVSMEDITGSSSYTYDGLGRLKTATNGSGKTVTYEYDEADNLKAILYPDGKKVSYAYDKNDNIILLTDRDGRSTSYEYDPLNRLTAVRRPDGTVSTYTYNARNEVLEAKNTCSCGFLISDYQYTYDNGGLITKEVAKECLFTSNKDYGHQGGEDDPCIHTGTNPWQNQNPEWETTERNFIYNDNGQLIKCTESKGQFDKATYTYEYDEAGNRTFAKKEKLYSYLESWQIRYTYNDDNQMTEAKKREGNLTKQYTFQYDANGNLTKECFRNKAEVTYQYDTENRLKAVYDPQKLLMASTYDGDGNRAFQLNYNTGAECGYGKNVSGEIFMPEHSTNEDGSLTAEGELFGYICSATGRAYDLTEYVNDTNREHAQVLMAYNINTDFDTESYAYAGNQRLSRNNIWNEARDVNHDEMSYYLYDGRGSVTANTWYNGMVTDVYQYDPYGQVTLGSTKHTDFYGYNAESYNPNTGLEYLRARYYNAEEGRFFQEDTYLGDITDPLTLNRYAYVKNSPLNYVDPSGHEPIGEEFLKPQKPSSEDIAEETGLNDWLIDMMLKLETSMQKRELEKNMKEAQKKAEVDKCGTAILTDKLFSFMISLIYGGIAAVLDNEMAMVTLPAGMAGKDTLVDMFRENAANELAYNIGALIGDIFSIIEGLSKVALGISGAAAGAALAAQSGGATITVSGSGLALAADGMLITISGASNAAKIMISEATSHGGGKNEGDSESDLGDYKFKEGIDEDLRGGKGTFKEALDKAFEKTGTPKEDFEVTKWGRDQYGKSHPVEWRAPNGAEVSVDIGHPVKSGAPTADHVGWQTGGKRGSGGGVRGHIFVDEVPYNR